ncbi:choline kinase [Spirochaetia bacterium]|nr:choline kinase [Spirochaetia bacterium]
MKWKKTVPKVDNAIILAAGFGSRFVPITFDIPKGLVPVKGIPMLERQIQQLQEKDIYEIIIVVGYLKEKFNYLKDKYNVKLVYNPEFAVKNNLSSIYYAREYLKNSYILSADNWIQKNIFNTQEDHSWYSCVFMNGETPEWCVKTDKTGRISAVTIGGKDSWVMYGPVFLQEAFSKIFKNKIIEYYQRDGTDNYMWENVFIDEIANLNLYINKQTVDNIYEFESIEELRDFDPVYGNNTLNNSLQTIAKVFSIKESEITGIKSIKVGMTNNSFSFLVGGTTYIFRHPGVGTDILINRYEEKSVYTAIKNQHCTDKVVFIDEHSGIKISEFYQGAVNTNAANIDDVKESMNILRNIHQSGIKVNHRFEIGKEIERYICLCNDKKTVQLLGYYEMYKRMKDVLNIIEKTPRSLDVLCHIDCNPDNFIRLTDNSIRIIDWEYAGMCDPIIDIAMYSIYSNYTRKQAENLLGIYLQHLPTEQILLRLYAYMSLGGFLWAIWTEYKQSSGSESGVVFGDYGTRMYNYATEFYAEAVK